MTNVGLMSQNGASIRTNDVFDVFVRSIMFLAAFLIVWISFQPFQDLSNPPPEIAEAGNRANQIGFTLLFLLLAAWIYFNDPQRLKILFRPALIVMLLWFALCVLTSWEPALSARRLAFSLIVMAIAAMAMLLPRNLRHFSGLLAAAALIVLALSYLGLLFAPSLAIHRSTDFLEPEHAGSWRGVFPHKNQAGATMVVFIFVGLFVARTRNLVLGGSIVVLSSVFLFFSNSKTAIALLPVVAIAGALVANTRRGIAIASVAAVLAILNLLSVGSIYFEPIREMLNMIISDLSFTGRTDIWQFAIEHVLERPITGYGFSAFWGTERVVHGLSQSSTWATSATDAHNGYLNLAVTVGLPGLALAVVWMVLLPIVDFYRIRDASAKPLQILLLRVWLFGLFASCFESMLFQQVGEVWFFMLAAAFGLRYLSTSRLSA